MGYVYLLLEVNDEGKERHKIGFSKNHPSLRKNQLQTGNSKKISVLTFYESKNYKKIENLLHAKYDFQRTDTLNEWFHLTDEQIKSFLDDCKKQDELIEFMLVNNSFFN